MTEQKSNYLGEGYREVENGETILPTDEVAYPDGRWIAPTPGDSDHRLIGAAQCAGNHRRRRKIATNNPTPAVVDVGYSYRPLTEGEEILPTDSYFYNGEWKCFSSKTYPVGERNDIKLLCQMRRAIDVSEGWALLPPHAPLRAGDKHWTPTEWVEFKAPTNMNAGEFRACIRKVSAREPAKPGATYWFASTSTFVTFASREEAETEAKLLAADLSRKCVVFEAVSAFAPKPVVKEVPL